MIASCLVVLSVFSLVQAFALWLQHSRHKREMLIMQMAINTNRAMMTTTLELLNARTPEQRATEIDALTALWGGTETARLSALANGEQLPLRPTISPQGEVLFTTSPTGQPASMMVTRAPNQLAGLPYDLGYLTFRNMQGEITRMIEIRPEELRAIAEGLDLAADRLDRRVKGLSVWELIRRRI